MFWPRCKLRKPRRHAGNLCREWGAYKQGYETGPGILFDADCFWKPIAYRWDGRWLGQQLSFSENSNSVQKTRNRKPIMTFGELLTGLDSLEQASDMCG